MLTSIILDGGRTATQTFTSLTDAATWIDERQGKQNIYFTVNPTRKALTSKAKKSDIAAMDWLHVDIDPRNGEDLEREKVRILKALEVFEPKPTVIINSGGGYQAFWKLAEPQVIDSEAMIAELEAYNQQLEIQLGGDHCHNIDRIMRLPGTINVPDARKKRKGRVPVLAALESAEWSLEHELKVFTPAASVQVQGDGKAKISRTTGRVNISGNLTRYDSVDDLPEQLSGKMKQIIVQGDDPDDPTRFPSRSESLFAVCCELVRCGLTDDQIAAVITDKDFGISASVLEKPRSKQYAARQIERAREHGIDPDLAQMNQQFAVILNHGGKCLVAIEDDDPSQENRQITFQTPEEFRKRISNRFKQVESPKGLVRMPLAKWWLEHPHRRQYERVIFSPTKEVKNCLNLWRGFRFVAEPGNLHESFLGHIREILCDGNAELYDYLVKWMARLIQKPDKAGEVAIVLQGGKGTGKSVFANHFGKLFGSHFVTVTNAEHLIGRFNSHLQNCLLLFADEAFYTGDKAHDSQMKALITESEILIEAKGLQPYKAQNMVHLLVASNHDRVVPYTADERRYFVLKMNPKNANRHDHFKRIVSDLERGGYKHLLFHLQQLSLDGWNHRQVPLTVAAQEQLQANLDPLMLHILDMLREGVSPGKNTQKQGIANLFCPRCAAEEWNVSRHKLVHRLRQLGILTNNQIERRSFRNQNGEIVSMHSKEPHAQSWGKSLCYLNPLATLRERLSHYLPHDQQWPNDGNCWRLEEEPSTPF